MHTFNCKNGAQISHGAYRIGGLRLLGYKSITAFNAHRPSCDPVYKDARQVTTLRLKTPRISSSTLMGLLAANPSPAKAAFCKQIETIIVGPANRSSSSLAWIIWYALPPTTPTLTIMNFGNCIIADPEPDVMVSNQHLANLMTASYLHVKENNIVYSPADTSGGKTITKPAKGPDSNMFKARSAHTTSTAPRQSTPPISDEPQSTRPSCHNPRPPTSQDSQVLLIPSHTHTSTTHEPNDQQGAMEQSIVPTTPSVHTQQEIVMLSKIDALSEQIKLLYGCIVPMQAALVQNGLLIPTPTGPQPVVALPINNQPTLMIEDDSSPTKRNRTQEGTNQQNPAARDGNPRSST